VTAAVVGSPAKVTAAAVTAAVTVAAAAERAAVGAAAADTAGSAQRNSKELENQNLAVSRIHSSMAWASAHPSASASAGPQAVQSQLASELLRKTLAPRSPDVLPTKPTMDERC